MTDHETIVISALRYALPRRSYIMSVTEDYIRNMKPQGYSKQFLIVAIEDIEEFQKKRPMDNLQHDWVPLMEFLKADLKKLSPHSLDVS